MNITFLATPGTPAVPWSRWLRLFENFLLTSGFNELPPARRQALLLHCLGPEGQHIFVALPQPMPSPPAAAAADEAGKSGKPDKPDPYDAALLTSPHCPLHRPGGTTMVPRASSILRLHVSPKPSPALTVASRRKLHGNGSQPDATAEAAIVLAAAHAVRHAGALHARQRHETPAASFRTPAPTVPLLVETAAHQRATRLAAPHVVVPASNADVTAISSKSVDAPVTTEGEVQFEFMKWCRTRVHKPLPDNGRRREFLIIVHRTTEFLWQLSLQRLRSSVPKKCPASTGDVKTRRPAPTNSGRQRIRAVPVPDRRRSDNVNGVVAGHRPETSTRERVVARATDSSSKWRSDAIVPAGDRNDRTAPSEVKRHVFEYLGLSPNRLCELFGEADKHPDETWWSTSVRARTFLDSYLDSKNVRSFEELKELLISDRIKVMATAEAARHVVRTECGGCMKPKELSRCLEHFVETKRICLKPEHVPEKPKVAEKAEAKRFRDKKRRKCFACKAEGDVPETSEVGDFTGRNTDPEDKASRKTRFKEELARVHRQFGAVFHERGGRGLGGRARRDFGLLGDLLCELTMAIQKRSHLRRRDSVGWRVR
ncbi:hypothetical protein HPB47_005184 [Ixodes persulcatus]|uniref:Uncharacterized protein n=1 Tax=Ixodes persulcatus TaxID=34615 RepID=A0AC60PDN2_IXOPE|nr:hypothetical protein HPB47_005184 [Ixodes persulcatus]